MPIPNPVFLLVPYRFSTGSNSGSIFSQLPIDGTGDFTYIRPGSASFIGSDGNIQFATSHSARILNYYSGSGTCPAFLIEPSAQNLALQSQDFSNAIWLAQNSATVNTNTAASPTGAVNADTINLAAVVDSNINQTITVANSTTYTISCFYKNIALTAGDTFRMRFDNGADAPNNFVAAALIDLALGTATYTLTGTSGTGFLGTATGRIENYGNGWYRVSVTFTVGSAGGVQGNFEVGYVNAATARSFYAWGAQLEVGSVPTSYIPTTTAAVTRGADVVSKTAVSTLIGQTEGTIYVDAFIPKIASVFVVAIGSSGGIGEAVYLEVASNLDLRARIRSASTAVDLTISAANWSAGLNKAAFTYGSGNCSLVLNGGSPVTGTVTFVPTCDRVVLGSRVDVPGTLSLTNRIRPIALYPNRLTNAQLQALTT